MVISFDAPVSYTYPNQEDVIKNLVRIAKKRIMLSVSSRLGSLPYFANPINKNQFILDEKCNDNWVQWCIKNKQDTVKQFTFHKESCGKMLETGLFGDGKQEISEFENGGAPWPITYTFLPDELYRILDANGVKNIQMAGPGAYARTIPREILVNHER